MLDMDIHIQDIAPRYLLVAGEMLKEYQAINFHMCSPSIDVDLFSKTTLEVFEYINYVEARSRLTELAVRFINTLY